MSDPALAGTPDTAAAPILADPALYPEAQSVKPWALSPTVPTDGPTASAGIAQYAGDVGTAVGGIIPAKVRAVVYSAGYFIGAALGAVAVSHVIHSTTWDYLAGIGALSIFSFSHALALSNTPKSK